MLDPCVEFFCFLLPILSCQIVRIWCAVDLVVHQGYHDTVKTGNSGIHFSRQEKHREITLKYLNYVLNEEFLLTRENFEVLKIK